MNIAQPESVGFSTVRLGRISKVLQGYVDRKELAGIAVTIARRGKTIFQDQVGMMDIEAQKPLQPDSIYRIASMTKPVTSVAAMMLYEEGHFHLNTPVSQFIPEFEKMTVYQGEDQPGAALERPITFRHLFTHTSGLCGGSDSNNPLDRMFQEKMKAIGERRGEIRMRDFIAELITLPLASQPGTRWRYGMNIDILGLIVELISGQTLAEYMQQRIFDPLGMKDTAFYVPAEKCKRLAALYGHIQGKEGLQRLPNQEAPMELPSFQSGGGGLYSTLHDYARFLQMMAGGGELNRTRLLSPRTVGLYSMNHTPAQALPYGFAPKEDLYHAGYGYSLGTRVLQNVSQSGICGSAGEFGWDGAFSTYFWVDPLMELYGLMMLQHYPNAYYPIAQQFKQLTYQAIVD
jgi:CubicO group peptidase (beta-lactamase class C family)